MDFVDELAWRAFLFIESRPLFTPDFKCFILPYVKALRIDDGWLDYFFSRKDAPSDGAHSVGAEIGVGCALDVNGLVGERWEPVDVIQKYLQLAVRQKQFQVRFLVGAC